jgi:hypothetical protein
MPRGRFHVSRQIPPACARRVRAFSLEEPMSIRLRSQGAEPEFQAKAITRNGHLVFVAALGTVFPLFTPQGERHWAEGWDPQILFPRDRDVAEGMVFQTRDRDGRLLTWTITRYDETTKTVAYNVVTPDFLVRKIEVRCRPAGTTRTEVDVIDSYVGLTSHGNGFIDHLTEAEYAKKMAQWKENIDRYLASLAKLPQ